MVRRPTLSYALLCNRSTARNACWATLPHRCGGIESLGILSLSWHVDETRQRYTQSCYNARCDLDVELNQPVVSNTRPAGSSLCCALSIPSCPKQPMKIPSVPKLSQPKTNTPKCTSIKDTMVSSRWYLGLSKGSWGMLARSPGGRDSRSAPGQRSSN